jgi:hypothetical protein
MPRERTPFWLPASNYYVLAVAVTAAFFFVIWGVLHDAGEEMPWVTAGVAASIVLAGAVVLRELILRHPSVRSLRQRVERNEVDRRRAGRMDDRRHHNKLTIERNAAILQEIANKSDAARVLSKYSSGHREVVELCAEYGALVERELKTVRAGSPRLAALLKGRMTTADLHRFHLLKWAEIEAQSLTDEARRSTNITGRIAAAQNALDVIESALSSYPSEPSLLESRDLLRELTVSIKVSHWVEKAERAELRGDAARAVRLYNDALMQLGRDNIRTPERDEAARRIGAQLARLRSAGEDLTLGGSETP